MVFDTPLLSSLNINSRTGQLTYNQHDRGSDHAQDDDVVDGHPHQPRVVDLPDLDRTSLIGQEQPQHQLVEML